MRKIMHKLAVAITFFFFQVSSPFSLLKPIPTNRRWTNNLEFKTDRLKSLHLTSRDSHQKASSSTSSTEMVHNEQRRNKFEFDGYEKPIVLIGCRGAGDELNKLASTYVRSMSPDSTAQAFLRDFDEQDISTDTRRKVGGVITTVGSNSRGTWVLTYADIQQKLQSNVLDKSNVIVIDYDSPEFYVEEGKYANKLTQHLTDLSKSLYEDENMLVIYINVHPELSGMSRGGRERKSNLEENVFIRYSDYELCIKDEGLDVVTIMTKKLLMDKEFINSSKEEGPAKSLMDEPANLIQTDSFTRMLQPTSPEQEKILKGISEEQIFAWESLQWLFFRLLARAFLPTAVPGSLEPSYNSAALTMGQNTFFLSLSFPRIADARPYIEAMCEDVDAMEFRVDLLSCTDDRFEVLHSMQQLRTMCRPFAARAPMLPFLDDVIDDSLPVVYTVRTANQAGKHPDDDSGIMRMFDLLRLGLRSAVEVLDVESAWNKEEQVALLESIEDHYTAQILGSHHIVNQQVTTEEAAHLFRNCSLKGRAHGAKVVLSITDEAMDRQAFIASKIAEVVARRHGDPHIPHIGLILGEIGKFSRVLNVNFTPVTHESLPFIAAPGQMTANEIMASRLLLGLLKPKKFAILGHHISYSVSPAMHGAAFAATKLPHSYSLIDLEQVEEFVNSDFWKDENFGGCSVTIPHKQAIIPFLNKLTDAANIIGAVNTIIVDEDIDEDGQVRRTFRGDNTDWRGIYNPLKRKIKIKNKGEKRNIALILGSGGTARAAAFAAGQLGLDLIFYNRTPSKAVELANYFSGSVVTSLGERDSHDPILTKFHFDVDTAVDNSLASMLGANADVIAVISTLPAAAGFELPDWFLKKYFESDQKPVIFDVNYKPYETKLLLQAQRHGFPIVRGSEMLWEQGVRQFELWTKRTAPYKVMKGVVLANCRPDEDV
jgi:shikimate-5-dehydrogenase/3-dehydroquinate dehydratase type I